jgi:hypothetical protein
MEVKNVRLLYMIKKNLNLLKNMKEEILIVMVILIEFLKLNVFKINQI